MVHLSRLLAAHRRRLNTPRGSRVLGTFRQAAMVLRWFRERGCVHCLARVAGVSPAPGPVARTRDRRGAKSLTRSARPVRQTYSVTTNAAQP
ncbi:hypothetical protein ACFV5K_10275, partial [Streptomyces sp. NPDC059744]